MRISLKKLLHALKSSAAFFAACFFMSVMVVAYNQTIAPGLFSAGFLYFIGSGLYFVYKAKTLKPIKAPATE